MIGFISIFPIIYIPGLNTVVFKHAPISWEWGIVFTESLLFFMGVEAWKFCKRIYFRGYADKVANLADELARGSSLQHDSTVGSTDGNV